MATKATLMTPEEVNDFLDSQRTLTLVTLKKDGAPVAHAMWFTRLGNAIHFNTQTSSLKYKNILLDSRVCLHIEAGESYLQLKGVMIQGHCVKVEDPEELAQVRAAREKKDARIGSGLEEMPSWFGGSRTQRVESGKRINLKVPMEKVYSWDFSKIRAHYTKS